jgi:glycosyltransferase involved in cell wall biosynthesis
MKKWEPVLDIEIGQLGLKHDGSAWPWPTWRVENEAEWAWLDLPGVMQTFFRGRSGVVMSVWDPGRCMYPPVWAARFSTGGARVETWGYFAVDAEGVDGGFGGPAGDAVRAYDRVLAYGPFGAKVLKRVLGRDEAVQWLPHGLDTSFWKPSAGPRQYIGCVAANQVRKDYGTLFQAWALLRDRDPSLRFWLHCDIEILHWSVPELAAQFGFGEDLLVTRGGIGDEELRALYSQCLVTIAPGLGEGFGYPIVESLACGAPVIHVDYAGGAELVPSAGRVEATAWRLESCYVLKRPVLSAERVADAAWSALEWVRREPAVVEAYCRGAVAHLGWEQIERRWFSWVKGGVEKMKEGEVRSE